MEFVSGYWIVSGSQTYSGMGCGPADVSGYGAGGAGCNIKIIGTENGNDFSVCLGAMLGLAVCPTHISASYIEIAGCGYSCSSSSYEAGIEDDSNGGLSSNGGGGNFTFSHFYIHDVRGGPVFLERANTVVLDHSYIVGNASTTVGHAEGIADMNSQNVTISNNAFVAIEGSGYIVELDRGGCQGICVADSWNIFGNLFWSDSGNNLACQINGCNEGIGDGVIACINALVCTNWQIYQNDFVNVFGIQAGLCQDCTGEGDVNSTWTVENNLWWNNISPGVHVSLLTGCGTCQMTEDYNNVLGYIPGNLRGFLGTHDMAIETTPPSPFVGWDSSPANFMLAREDPTWDGGVTLGSPFNLDPHGITRGSDSYWDLGAFQFGPYVVTLNSLNVTPSNVSLPVNGTQQFTATGTYSDGSTQNLNSSVNWTSGNNMVAWVAGAGMVTAIGVGNASVQAASGSVTAGAGVTVTQAAQVITFTPPATVIYGVSPITLTATGGGSNNAVSFSVVSGPASLNGSTLTINGAGTVVVSADQAGNVNYTAAPEVTRSIVVTQAAQAINFTPPTTLPYGVSPITLTATGGGSNNAVSFSVVSGPASLSGSMLTINGVGTVVISADQAGNANYSAAPEVTQSIVVSQAAQVITFTPPATVTYGVSSIALTATGGGSNNAVSFSVVSGPASLSGSTLTINGAGTVVVSADQAGNSNYTAAPQVMQSIAVNQAAMTISAANASRTFGIANPVFTGTVSGVVAGDSFSESFTTVASALSNVGTYAIVPSVTGANLSDYTLAVIPGMLTVTPAGTTTALVLSDGATGSSDNVTMTAQVASAVSGTPTGMVSFFVSGSATALCAQALSGTAANDTASCTAALTAGTTYSLTAAYSGDSNFSASSTANAVTITPPLLDFTIAASGSTTQTVTSGSAASYSFTIAPDLGAYAGTVTFVVSGLPVGATATFSPSSISATGGSQTVAMTVQTAATARQSGPPHTGPKVEPIIWAMLLMSLAGARAMRRHGLKMMLAALLLLSSIAATATLTGCGSPGNGSSPPPTVYTLTVTATAGSLQHSCTLTLNLL
jgi:hypothetical protein